MLLTLSLSYSGKNGSPEPVGYREDLGARFATRTERQKQTAQEPTEEELKELQKAHAAALANNKPDDSDSDSGDHEDIKDFPAKKQPGASKKKPKNCVLCQQPCQTTDI
mgnify:CR=1 FL=1